MFGEAQAIWLNDDRRTITGRGGVKVAFYAADLRGCLRKDRSGVFVSRADGVAVNIATQ